MLPAPKQPLKAPLRADPHGELVRLKEKIWQRYVLCPLALNVVYGWILVFVPWVGFTREICVFGSIVWHVVQ